MIEIYSFGISSDFFPTTQTNFLGIIIFFPSLTPTAHSIGDDSEGILETEYLPWQTRKKVA
jgi:hypothetical protein